MTDPIEQEIEAIRTLLVTLEPLEPNVRQSVLDYVLRRLDIKLSIPQHIVPGEEMPSSAPTTVTPPAAEGQEPEQTHIKDLKEQKQPRSAIEMATLVAYYLSHKAPPDERKDRIMTKDIETYFKIAGFKLPTKPQFTLPNTKSAGYLDAVGDGEYRLNPVGYNLVVHSMPKTKKAKVTRRPRKTTKAKAKKASSSLK